MAAEVKVCVECCHAERRDDGGALVCTAAYVDRVNGELHKVREYCWVRRRDWLLCGPVGAWFEPKD